jgi:hypothetical protein
MPQTTQYLRMPRWQYWKFPDPPNPLPPPPPPIQGGPEQQPTRPIQRPQPLTRKPPPNRSIF